MKNIITIYTLLFLFVFASCSDKDGTPEIISRGFLQIDNHRVELIQGYLEDYGARGDSYNLDFTALSQASSKTGAGAVVYFELFSSLDNDLAEGNYSLGTYSEAIANTFTQWGQCMLGSGVTMDREGLSVTTGISIRPTSGTFTVSESGTNYNVRFEGVGVANVYRDGELLSSQENVDFRMEYEGDVKRYEVQSVTTKSASTERPEKIHTIIF